MVPPKNSFPSGLPLPDRSVPFYQMITKKESLPPDFYFPISGSRLFSHASVFDGSLIMLFYSSASTTFSRLSRIWICCGGIRLCILQYLRYCLRRICQHTALDRLHDNHRFAVLSGYFVAGFCLNRRSLPVCVVDLQLYELHFRVLVQDLLQLFRSGAVSK